MKKFSIALILSLLLWLTITPIKAQTIETVNELILLFKPELLVFG